MWTLAPTDSWNRAYGWYSKKRSNELAAVLRNLNRYVELLNAAKNAQSVAAGFLHFEPGGVVAVDQKGGKNLQETRAYTFPWQETETLYLLTIGNKKQQPEDVKYCKKWVSEFRASHIT